MLLTAVTMLVEIAMGYLTASMALLSDGWHTGNHVAALGLASVAYAVSRRFAEHRAFVSARERSERWPDTRARCCSASLTFS